MNEEGRHFLSDEDFKDENDFLKMKMMLEHGAVIHVEHPDMELPAELENIFLNRVIELERRLESPGSTTVFEKIGKPKHFKPAGEIREEEIGQAWEALQEYMAGHGVELWVASPRITPRELYRFSTEELFECETDDLNEPGLTRGFIYDEFYPDHEYDNARIAVDDCISAIFREEPIEQMRNFAERVHLNDHLPLARSELKFIINRFKDLFDEIRLDEIRYDWGKMADNSCRVEGDYSAHAKNGNETLAWTGNWHVDFESDEEGSCWYIKNIRIAGVPF